VSVVLTSVPAQPGDAVSDDSTGARRAPGCLQRGARPGD